MSFEKAEEIFDDRWAIEEFDELHSTLEESRFRILGRVKSQLVVVVAYTPHNGKLRIISARPANSRERYIMTDLEKSKIIAACEAVAVSDDEINYSEIPEITDFSGFRPLAQHTEYFKSVKEQVSIRFNKVLLDHLRSKGKGWQAEVNDFLMSAYMRGQI